MLLKNERIYVAGHTGLIGSAFVRRLAAEKYTTVLTKSHAELELTDNVDVDHFFKQERPDYVIMAAGKVGGIQQNQETPADFIDANLAIQSNVLRAAHRHDVKRLVLFGSSCMYPRECPQPMAETALFTGHPEPTSIAYAVSKIAGVELCRAYNRQSGINKFVPVIPNSAYGPNDNFDSGKGHVLSALMSRFHNAKINDLDSVTLWGSGRPRREFIHADDIANAVMHLLGLPKLDIEFPINIGCGIDYSIKELANHIACTVGYSKEILWDHTKPDGAPRKLLDSTRLRKTNWVPAVAFEDGLKSTYEWYKINNSGQVK
jgi:GDP-L-fucose synthase